MDFSILKRGFLPSKISTTLSKEFDDIEYVGNNLPKILANNQIESEVLNLEPEKDISNLGFDELERAMLLYSYIGHAYIWGNLKTDKVIPKNISKRKVFLCDPMLATGGSIIKSIQILTKNHKF